MPKFTVLIMTLTLLVTLASATQAENLTVQTQETSLRAAPSFTGRPLATLRYGQLVDSLARQGAWLQVKATGVSGWVHQSALTNRQLNLSSGGKTTTTTASEREVSMAGKGFNASIEKEYRSQHSGGYAQVDAMLKSSYSPQQLYSFLTAGQLKPQEVGQ